MIDGTEYMELALTLAEKGRGEVEPNPMVGCVIVKNDKIIGKGYHEKFGNPHAEINALKNCEESPAGAVMYVTLEPCCHFGKTDPCTEAIIKAKLGRVVVAMTDPTRKVSGKGVEQLRQAGITVDVGLCQKQAQKLNAPFIKFAEMKKPWVIVKWAQSRDGFLARSDGIRWISGEQSRADAHKLRKRVQGILVGINTILADNPLLTARPGRDSQPLRIVLDSKLRIPLDCKLFTTIKEAPVLVCTTEDGFRNSEKVAEIKAMGGDVFASCDLEKVLEYLGGIGVQQLLAEGGAKVIDSFLTQNLADEVVIYIAPMKLGEKDKVSISEAMAQLGGCLNNVLEKRRFEDDVRLSGFIEKTGGK